MLYHLIRCDTARLANEVFTSSPIVTLRLHTSDIRMTYEYIRVTYHYIQYLLLLFVFNIHTLAIVITVISSVRRVITNDQGLTEYSRLYISNTFLSILPVPNKGVFCITPTLHVMPSFPIHLSNSAETLPRARITTGKPKIPSSGLAAGSLQR